MVPARPRPPDTPEERRLEAGTLEPPGDLFCWLLIFSQDQRAGPRLLIGNGSFCGKKVRLAENDNSLVPTGRISKAPSPTFDFY